MYVNSSAEVKTRENNCDRLTADLFVSEYGAGKIPHSALITDDQMIMSWKGNSYVTTYRRESRLRALYDTSIQHWITSFGSEIETTARGEREVTME